MIIGIFTFATCNVIRSYSITVFLYTLFKILFSNNLYYLILTNLLTKDPPTMYFIP